MPPLYKIGRYQLKDYRAGTNFSSTLDHDNHKFFFVASLVSKRAIKGREYKGEVNIGEVVIRKRESQ